MADTTEKDALGIIYIDAPLPATVLNEAYRMQAEWERRQRVIPPEETRNCSLRSFGRRRGLLWFRCVRPSHHHSPEERRYGADWAVDPEVLYAEMTRK
jgi:hypothetical protein